MVTQKPPGECYSQARSFKALEYQRIGHNLDHMRACLASGYPFVFGIKVFSSFEGDAVRKSGHLKMPRKGERTVGLHAVVACGYDDTDRLVHSQEFLGRRVGDSRVLHNPLRVSPGLEDISRLLDHTRREVDSDPGRFSRLESQSAPAAL